MSEEECQKAVLIPAQEAMSDDCKNIPSYYAGGRSPHYKTPPTQAVLVEVLYMNKIRMISAHSHCFAQNQRCRSGNLSGADPLSQPASRKQNEYRYAKEEPPAGGNRQNQRLNSLNQSTGSGYRCCLQIAQEGVLLLHNSQVADFDQIHVNC